MKHEPLILAYIQHQIIYDATIMRHSLRINEQQDTILWLISRMTDQEGDSSCKINNDTAQM